MGLPKIILIALLLPITSVLILIIKWHTLDLPRLEHPSFGELYHGPHSSITKLDDIDKKRISHFEKSKNISQYIDIDPRHDPERQPIIKLLQEAGFDLEEDPRFSQEMLASLPKWSEVLDLYGKPKVLGLETCQAYRESVPEDQRLIGTAGNFNSGTNLLQELIVRNCQGTSLWQVPWGKHWPASYRNVHQVENSRYAMDHSRVLPVVSVRDPYTWMQSQCRQPYEARFDHNKSLCPNIIPYDTDIAEHPRYAHKKYVPIRVIYHSENPRVFIKHDSLPDFWNKWNNEYVFNRSSTFPRLIVRLEDLVFHGREVIPQICECAGFQTKPEFHIKKGVANTNSGIDLDHTHGAGLLQSIIRYGNPMSRRKGYAPCQLWAARNLLDPRLMELFGYKYENKFGPDPKVWEDCFAYYRP